MRVLVLQHEPLDGPGYLGDALAGRGAGLQVVRLDLGEPLPDPSGYDALLVLGGEMNVYQEAEHSWLVEENRAIQAALADEKALLGVCLGGQLLAKALGAPIHLGATPEIGLIRVSLTDTGRADRLFSGLAEGLEVVAWHQDTFAIPAGAVVLASSAGCANQAFRFGRRAYGLQFHPEVTPAMLAAWLSAAEPLPDGPSFERAVTAKAEALQAQADRLIDNFLSIVS
ncbi:MAG TPA: type 1 glutamine amidotransferase [Chloroflexota bacterium]|jgi:GMP synthase-like glutamine amidotransferase